MLLAEYFWLQLGLGCHKLIGKYVCVFFLIYFSHKRLGTNFYFFPKLSCFK